MYEKANSGGNLGGRKETTTAKSIEFFLIGIVFIVVVGDGFLEEPVGLEVEGEETVFEDHVVKGGPVVLLADDIVDNDAVVIETYFEGAFGLVFQDDDQYESCPEQGCSCQDEATEGAEQEQIAIADRCCTLVANPGTAAGEAQVDDYSDQ
jgi:hypothetical protein